MSKRKQKDKRKSKAKPRKRRGIVKSKNSQKHCFEIKLDMVPAGYSANACQKGEKAQIICREFSSSEDGDFFISRMEGFPSEIIRKLPPQAGITESTIDNMLILIDRDKTASVFINYPILGKFQPKRSLKKGEAVFRDDICDVHELLFKDVLIPEDKGVLVVFSIKWTKALYFDFAPILPKESKKREYDINLLLGGYYSYLLFRDRIKIRDNEWELLFRNHWFPFISLKEQTIKDILNYNKSGWNIDDLLSKIKIEIIDKMPKNLELWKNIEAFKPHIKFFEEAFEQYEKGKDISCISILFPRIEGVLRTFHKLTNTSQKADQKTLADTVISDKVNPKHMIYSPLLPLKFNKYLSEYYFANFNPNKDDNPLSRHTVCHGVAGEEVFCLKASTLGFLILSQLAYYFVGINKKEEDNNES